ncbi:MAG: segregation/condensation protein A [Methylothermaceae bacterium]|nr:segregation/condensation protein A [Methylothermaceae bacterium]
MSEIATPLATLRGEPVTDLPENLYIPPDALRVFLEETFEGPLDLLLYLIRRRNLDIMAVSISQVIEQYLEYIALMEELKIELAAEYLLMAALLAEIKSRLLLPRQESDEAEEEDPRAELVRRLMEYEKFQQAARDLDALPRMARDIHPVNVEPNLPPRPPSYPPVSLEDLAEAFHRVLARAEQLKSHTIEREALSVRERMGGVLDRLRADRELAFENLFDPAEGRAGMVVTFLALLELCREGLVEILQGEPLAPLTVKTR